MRDKIIDLAPETDAYTRLPLCVDMDGTLLRIDTLHEAAVSALSSDWGGGLLIPRWLSAGKARLKAELAARWNFDPATLPYNTKLLEYLQREHAAGRRIILCTASHRDIAEPIAAYLGLFDEVIATDGQINLRGAAKADALAERLGPGGFVYAGNDATDHAVWDRAAAAMVVNAPASVARDVASRNVVEAVIDEQPSVVRGLIKAIRPHQWVKNALCLVPPIAAGDFLNPASWMGAILIAVAFCCVASGIYLINDITDLAADRAHPRKCRRPFASGAVPVKFGLMLAPALMVAGFTLGLMCGGLPALLLYVVSSMAYTLRLKELPLIDVFVLAELYTLRLFAGGQASGHPVSLWLLGFSSFLFLSLAMIKRVSELQKVAAMKARRPSRRGYMVEDEPILQAMGVASTFASAIVLSLFVGSQDANSAYTHPMMLWLVVPLLLFWQCRLWLSAARGYVDDDPIVYTANDRVAWAVFACLSLVVAIAWAPIRF